MKKRNAKLIRLSWLLETQGLYSCDSRYSKLACVTLLAIVITYFSVYTLHDKAFYLFWIILYLGRKRRKDVESIRNGLSGLLRKYIHGLVRYAFSAVANNIAEY
jgi:hypothetical protein